jgi:tRNA-dihydrouridine synthase A
MFKPESKNHKLCVAPMMDWTDRHCRSFHRLLSPHALLYSEMVTTGAILHGDQHRHLDFSPAEHPIALQLGGSDPLALAACAKIGQDWGYDEINLNCGCPSDRVQQGRFGACLMLEPKTVADCWRAMKDVCTIPVTIKCRIGVDDHDDEPFFQNFIDTIADAGCTTFIVHARKAWLNGLSPKENREIPPLRYDVVANIKAKRRDLTFILNGGINDLSSAQNALETFDGVMIGREAYSNPYFLAELEHALWNTPLPARDDIAYQMSDYIKARRIDDPTLPIHAVTRHMLGLYHAQKNGRLFRRLLTEGTQGTDVSPDIINTVLAAIPSPPISCVA